MNKASAIILVLLAFGIYYTFTSPQTTQLNAALAQEAQYQDAIGNAQKIAETRDALAASAQSIPAAEKDRLMKALPDTIDVVGIARDLDTIASQYGITVKDVSIESASDQGATLIVLPGKGLPYQKATVSFTFISTYPNFERFLGDLEKDLRLMDVESISFKPTDTGLYEHTIKADTYWLKK